MITGLDHIQLAMPPNREEPARMFFRDLLGMVEETKPEPLARAGHPVQWDDTLPDRQRFPGMDPFGNRIEFLRDGDGFGQR